MRIQADISQSQIKPSLNTLIRMHCDESRNISMKIHKLYVSTRGARGRAVKVYDCGAEGKWFKPLEKKDFYCLENPLRSPSISRVPGPGWFRAGLYRRKERDGLRLP